MRTDAERIGNKKMSGGIVGTTHRTRGGAGRRNFFESARKTFGIAREKCAGSIGEKFALARNGELDNQRDNRRKNCQHNADEHQNAGRIAAVVVAARKCVKSHTAQEKIRKKCDETDEHDDDRGDEHVAIADVRELVRDDTLELAAIQDLEQAGGDRHRRVLFISTSGKRIGLLLFYYIELRHWQAGSDRKIFDDVPKLAGARARSGNCGVYWLRAIHAEHDFVGIPVGADVHDNTKDDGEEKNAGIVVQVTKKPAETDYNREKNRHQKPGFPNI